MINPLHYFLKEISGDKEANYVLILFPFGALCGSLLAFIPTERWGRRFTLMVNCVLSCMGCIIVLAP